MMRAALILLLLVGMAHAEARVYVSNEKSGDVTVIDPATNETLATIPVGKRPRGIKISHDGKRIFVALSGTPITPPGQKERLDLPADKKADGIGVIDAVTMKIVGMLPSGSDPEQFSLSLDGTRLFISN